MSSDYAKLREVVIAWYHKNVLDQIITTTTTTPPPSSSYAEGVLDSILGNSVDNAYCQEPWFSVSQPSSPFGFFNTEAHEKY